MLWWLINFECLCGIGCNKRWEGCWSFVKEWRGNLSKVSSDFKCFYLGYFEIIVRGCGFKILVGKMMSNIRM